MCGRVVEKMEPNGTNSGGYENVEARTLNWKLE